MSGDVVLSQVIEDAKLFFSGIEQFDNLLDGLQSSQTLCIAGPSLSGKSRVCSQFCTEALTKHMRVCWINIGAQLNLDFVAQSILNNRARNEVTSDDEKECSDPLEVLNLLTIYDVSTPEELLAVLDGILKEPNSEENCKSAFDLLILDSLSLVSQLMFDWTSENKTYFGNLRHLLRSIQRKTKCAIIFTIWSAPSSFEDRSKVSLLTQKMLIFEFVEFLVMIDSNHKPSLV